MEDSPLNKAHQLERKAESLLRQRKFDECTECHKRAIEVLQESCELTDNTRALESIQLQIDSHSKQIENVLMKQKLYHQQQIQRVLMKKDEYRRQMANRARKLSNSNISTEDESLEAEIFRTIDVHDSLIGCLAKRSNNSDNDSYSTSDNDLEEKAVENTANFVGNKRPKDEATIIEELKVLSSQLRDFISSLLFELDERNKVIDKLTKRIQQLENDRDSTGNKSQKTNGSLKVITDSSGGTSPYVFSPCCELSPDIGSLPPLAPIEMPNIDFSAFLKHTNKSNNNQ